MRLICAGLGRAKPWQRQLAARMSDIDRLVQVLRLIIAMDKPDVEIVASAETVGGACRRASASLAGSRADYSALQAMALVGDLGDKLQAQISALVPAAP